MTGLAVIRSGHGKYQIKHLQRYVRENDDGTDGDRLEHRQGHMMIVFDTTGAIQHGRIPQILGYARKSGQVQRHGVAGILPDDRQYNAQGCQIEAVDLFHEQRLWQKIASHPCDKPDADSRQQPPFASFGWIFPKCPKSNQNHPNGKDIYNDLQ